jgi:hypothetical protein
VDGEQSASKRGCLIADLRQKLKKTGSRCKKIATEPKYQLDAPRYVIELFNKKKNFSREIYRVLKKIEICMYLIITKYSTN